MGAIFYNTQVNFTGGVLAESANSRGDTDLYQKALNKGENIIIIPQGGFSRRPASEFTKELDNINDGFVDDNSVLKGVTEGNNHYIFFFNTIQYGIYNVITKSITGFSYPGGITFTLDEIQKASIVITRDSVLLFSVKQPIKINNTTPFASSFFTIKNPPTNDYGDIDYSSINFSATPVSGANVTLTASSPVFTSAYVGGRFFGNGGNLRITQIDSNMVVKGNTTSDFIDTSTFSGGVSYLGEPVFSSTRGWPEAAAYGFSRLWVGNTSAIPNGIWWSVNNTVNNFDSSDANATSAGGGTLGARGSSNIPKIKKIFITNSLFCFTSQGIWASPRLVGEGVSTTNISLEFQDIYVIKDKTEPVYMENKVHFISSSGKAIISSRYNINTDTYQFDNSTLISEDLINNPTHLVAFPFDDNTSGSFMMVINGNNTFAWNMTIDSISESAWTSGTCAGKILNGVIIDNDFYIFTQRSNTSTLYWLEKVSFNKLMDAQSDFTNTSSLIVPYLKDLEVGVIQDGEVIFTTVPTSGTLPLSETFQDVKIGLNFIPHTIPLSPTINLQNGSALYRRKSIGNIKIDVLKSAGITVEGQEISNFVIDQSLLGSTLDLITEIIEIAISGSISFRPTYNIKQIYPAPMIVKGLETQYEVKV